MAEITGGCLCGAVRFTATAEPVGVRQCWCRDCRYWSAGTATINVAFPEEAVTLTGDLTIYDSVAESGNGVHRGFCPRCGTPVATRSDGRPGIVSVRGGTLDDPAIARPRQNIWTQSAPEWAVMDETIPRTERQT